MRARTIWRNVCAATLLSVAGGAAAAQGGGYLYDCEITEAAQAGGWISPRIAIVVTPDSNIRVIDALTLTFEDAPVPATVLRDDPVRLVIRWTLSGARADSGRSFAYFDYRASLSRATGHIEVTAGPRGYDTGLRGSGQCRIRSE